jgi:hypothetical protein
MLTYSFFDFLSPTGRSGWCCDQGAFLGNVALRRMNLPPPVLGKSVPKKDVVRSGRDTRRMGFLVSSGLLISAYGQEGTTSVSSLITSKIVKMGKSDINK